MKARKYHTICNMQKRNPRIPKSKADIGVKNNGENRKL